MKNDLQLANASLLPLRFRPIAGQMLITNDIGRYAWLSGDEFEALISDTLDENGALLKSLRARGFIRQPGHVTRLARDYRARNAFLDAGPNLHILITTLRCNYTCLYCHASRENMAHAEFDMSEDTARKAVDLIFQSTSPSINIEFQGGEPLANWPVLSFVVNYAKEKNLTAKKDLAFTLVTNLSLMDEEKLAFLVDNDIYVCTSIDGPRELHEKNRLYGQGSSYDLTVKWLNRFHDAYKARGYDIDLFHVDALMTATRHSLPLYKEIVDEYVRLGLKSIHLRPLNPFGFVNKTWDKIGYTTEEFAEFYKKALDYIISLNLQGVELIERMSSIYLSRILTNRDANYMELRSPCGAGIGQIAYNYDGQIFTCDEGRMMAKQGVDLFRMGHLETDGYGELLESDAVRTLVLASIQDGLPLCNECAYKPYCGVCPIYNYSTEGDLVGKGPSNGRCKLALSSFDALFGYLKREDPAIMKVFERWITLRQRQVEACDPKGCACEKG